MADQWNANIPALGNQVADDIADIKENLEHSKDALQRLFETWSDAAGGNSAAKIDSATGFNDGTYNYEFPTNGVAAHSVIMLGNSDTITWLYVNAAPPGWKVTTTGKGTVLSISDTTGTSNGTTTDTTGSKLRDSGATFSSDGVVVGDTAYNVTDGTVTTVTAVDSEIALSVTDDYFASGEEYIVGKPYVEAGGRQAANGSWTQPNHTLTEAEMPAHVHTVEDLVSAAGLGSGANFNHGGSTNTGSKGGDGAHNHGTAYRPAGSIGKLFQLDTA